MGISSAMGKGFSHLLILLEWYNRQGLPGQVPGDVPGHDRLRGEETLEHLTLLITQTGDLRTEDYTDEFFINFQDNYHVVDVTCMAGRWISWPHLSLSSIISDWDVCRMDNNFYTHTNRNLEAVRSFDQETDLC